MKTVSERSEVPDAPAYVMCNDTFMSGWGQAEGKTNTIILPCKSWDEAEVVAANARRRGEQVRVRIVANKPRLHDHVLYSLLTKESSPTWYERGAFRRSRE